jgi:drug/metabolite transporter (DMT)-like permease
MFVIADVITKSLAYAFPTNELIFFRSWLIAGAILILIVAKRHRLRPHRALSLPMLSRCVFDCVSILGITTALIHMGLGELYAILLTSPLLITLMAAACFGAPIGIRRGLAIVIGFAGVLLIVKPSLNSLDWWALVAFAAAFASAAREVITERIDTRAPSFEVTLYSAVTVGLATPLVAFNETWTGLTVPQSLFVLAQACAYLCAAVFLVRACRLLPLSLVASLRYSQLLWGGLAGYVLFRDVPDLGSLAGAALIAASGLYALHYERLMREDKKAKISRRESISQ